VSAAGIDLRMDLTTLSQQIKATDKATASSLRKNLRNAISESGADLVGGMRSRASWSSRIPGAIGLTVRFSTTRASVRVQVDHNKAPHARPLELGNKTTFDTSVLQAHGGLHTQKYRMRNGQMGTRQVGKRSTYAAMRRTNVGVGRALDHPVWARADKQNGWSSMALRPFFFAAVEARSPAINTQFEAILDQVAKDAGFQ